MPPRELGIGILGTSFGAAVHLPGFMTLPGARVIGIASRRREQSAALAQQHGLPRAFDSWQELIACPDIQVISISTPPVTHDEFVRAALAAGKAVLCEKPFTLHARQAQGLLELAQQKGVAHAVDFEFRELPAWKVFHDHLRNGSLGTPTRAVFTWHVGTWADPKRPWRWQCDAAQGGGVLAALGVHLLDATEWLFGPVQSLQAVTSIAVTQRTDDAGVLKPVTSADAAQVRMTTAGGLPVELSVSNVDPSGAGLSMTIEGERGVLTLASTSREYGSGFSVYETPAGGQARTVHQDKSDPAVDARIPPFQALAGRFLTAVRNGDRGFQPSFAEGLRSQLLLDAIHASNAASSRVDIPKPAK